MAIDISRFLRPTGIEYGNKHVADLFPGILKSYQEGVQHKQGKEKHQAEQDARLMENALTREFGKEKMLADIASKQAYAQYMLNPLQYASPFGKLFQERQALANKFGTSAPEVQMFDKYIESQSQPTSTLTAAQRAYSSLTPQQRENMLAEVRPLTPHMNDLERMNLLNSGATLEGIREQAKANGIQVEDVTPQFVPTTPIITQMKQQEGALAEIDVLENNITSGMAPYSRTFFGFSPKQVAEALSGENLDDQARFLAARAMQPELAGVRTRLAQGSTAQEALRDMTEKSLGNAKIFKPLVNDDVYNKMQKYMNQWLKEATRARTRAAKGLMSEQELYGTKGEEAINGAMRNEAKKLSNDEILRKLGGE